ncbi:MAG: Hpt domain-containing protein, partial [bacterium]
RAGETAGDFKAVELAAHSVKSSAANFGAQRLYSLAEQTERLAAEKNRDRIPALLGDLEDAFVQVKTCLEEEKKGLEE